MAHDAEDLAGEILSGAQALVAISVRSLDSLDDKITMPQLRVLTVLHLRGETNLSMLAETLGTSLSSASRLCDRLVAADLIRRRTSDRTRREIRLTLTPAGTSLLAEVDARRTAEISRVLDQLPARRRRPIASAFAEFARVAAAMGELAG